MRTTPNLWDSVKSVLTKILVVNAYMKKKGEKDLKSITQLTH